MWYTNKPWDHKCESNDSPQKYFAFWRGANIKASGKLKDPLDFGTNIHIDTLPSVEFHKM